MAIQVQKQGAVIDDVTGTQISATFATQPVSGNTLVVMYVGGAAWTDAPGTTISGTGWTQRVAQASAGAPPQSAMVVWTKTVGAAEPTAITVTTQQTDSGALFMYEYSGLDNANLVEFAATTNNTSPATQLATIGATVAGSAVLFTAIEHRNNNGDQNYGVSASWAKEFDLAANGGGGANEFNAASATRVVPAGTYVNTFTWQDTSTFGGGMNVVIALRDIGIPTPVVVDAVPGALILTFPADTLVEEFLVVPRHASLILSAPAGTVNVVLQRDVTVIAALAGLILAGPQAQISTQGLGDAVINTPSATLVVAAPAVIVVITPAPPGPPGGGADVDADIAHVHVENEPSEVETQDDSGTVVPED